MKRSRIRPVSDRRRKRDAGYAEARRQVYEREDGFCQVIGPDCTGDGEQVHHVAGRLGPDPHRLENLLLCCAADHRTIHAYPEWATARGWMQTRLGGDAS